jgi:ABC-type nitrate/sulfonate/bicarbonate transport system ATPase subunit
VLTYTKSKVLLSIKDITLKFGDKLILNKVNAEVQDIERPDLTQGQVVCFLGPSGIGKTQLARIIAGLSTPTAGSIILADGHPTSAGKVGFVQQNYPLFDYMTVAENLSVAANMGHLSKGQSIAKITEYWTRLDLPLEVATLYPKQLSGGQRQRVAILRQLLCSEHLLILDEPFSGLDIVAKQAACHLISDVAALDTLMTIIIITHDVTEGLSIADTAWLLGKDGSGGASIQQTYDLAEMGLAWDPNIQQNPAFTAFVREVKNEFLEMAPQVGARP